MEYNCTVFNLKNYIKYKFKFKLSQKIRWDNFYLYKFKIPVSKNLTSLFELYEPSDDNHHNRYFHLYENTQTNLQESLFVKHFSTRIVPILNFWEFDITKGKKKGYQYNYFELLEKWVFILYNKKMSIHELGKDFFEKRQTEKKLQNTLKELQNLFTKEEKLNIGVKVKIDRLKTSDMQLFVEYLSATLGDYQ